MKKISILLFCSIILFVGNALALITVTTATNGTNICANQATTGIAPAPTALGTITIRENNNNDFGAGGTGVNTVTIKTSGSWQFNTSAIPTLTGINAARFTILSGGFSDATTYTIVLQMTGVPSTDRFTINGLEIQATSTSAGASNVAVNSTSGTMNGLTVGTSLAALSQTPSLTTSVTVGAAPAGAICAGTNVTFTAGVTNGGTPTFQWFLNGVAEPGATNNTYSSTTLATGNTIYVNVTGTGCVSPASVNSNTITMTVNAVPNPVTVSAAGAYCNNTTLTASLTGAGTVYFQGVQSGGTSTATPSTSQLITTAGTNTYYFRARDVSGCWGPEGSAKVAINLPPGAITVAPATTATVCIGGSTTFSVSATAPVVTALQEDFNSGAPGWSINSTAGNAASAWQIRNSPGLAAPSDASTTLGDGSPYMQSVTDAFNGVTTTIFTSPSFSLAGFTAASLTFNQRYRRAAGSDVTVAIEYSIDGGGIWNTLSSQVASVNNPGTWASTTPTTTLVLPPAMLNQPNVMLRWNYSSNFGWYWTIDNIAVRGTPTLTYDWAAATGTDLSCATCDANTITPSLAGSNVYTVSSTTTEGCASTATATVDANALPTIFNLTGGGHYCSGSTAVSVGLDGSETGVNYDLYNGAVFVSTLPGTGSALDFGPQIVDGIYSVVATNSSTTCTSNMNGLDTVVTDPLPMVFNMSGGGQFCSGGVGVPVGLDGSDPGISYQLYEGATPAGSPVLGTGGAFDFGVFTTPGTYSVIATDTTSHCTNNMNNTSVVVENPLPTQFSVTGGGSYCPGTAGVDVSLAGSTTGIDYQLYNGATMIGSAVPGTGAAISFGLQTLTGTYTVVATDATTLCTSNMLDSAVVDLFPTPAAIGGPLSVCVGSMITLTDDSVGGTWNSSDPTIASINTMTGDLMGNLAGTATITYTMPTTCFVTADVTVNALPAVAPISGATNICLGSTVTLTDADAGGVWTSADPSIASIDAVTGDITGNAVGTTTISYAVTNGVGCTTTVTMVDTVTALPVVAPITGPTHVCVAASVTLASATAGGTWTSSDVLTGTIDPVTGLLTGVAAGTVTITYTVTGYPGCSASVTTTETVDALPVIAPITGDNNECAGRSMTLANATSGGTWSSSDVTVATVNAGGVVSGIAFGAATISYTVTNAAGCTDAATYSITIGNAMPSTHILPAVSSITLCTTTSITLNASTPGLMYQWSMDGMGIVGATTQSYVAAGPGTYSLEIDNGTCHLSVPAISVLVAPVATINLNTAANLLYTGTFASYQWFLNGTAISGATTSLLSVSAPGNYSVVVADVNGCTDTAETFTYLGSEPPTAVGNTGNDKGIRIYPNPATTVLFIDAPAHASVSIIGTDGRTIIAQQEAVSLNISHLANGVYMVMIYDEHGILLKTERFSKVQ